MGEFNAVSAFVRPSFGLMAAIWTRADALMPAALATAGAVPSTDCSGQTACATAPCSWPALGSAPSHVQTAV